MIWKGTPSQPSVVACRSSIRSILRISAATARSSGAALKAEMELGMVRTLDGRGIEHRDIWVAARRLGLYTISDADLWALTARQEDPVIAAAACYIIGLRRELAAGAAC
jgi:hypothetical protein